MTTDLLQPGPAEQLLLLRVRDELGAGIYPNEERSPVDVAEALIRTVRSARQRGVEVTARELLRQAQLRSDLGAVVRANPVDRALEVARPATVGILAEAAGTSAADGGILLVADPPGQRKSWACQQLVDQLTGDRWLVAEHYCYLGDADGDQLTRWSPKRSSAACWVGWRMGPRPRPGAAPAVRCRWAGADHGGGHRSAQGTHSARGARRGRTGSRHPRTRRKALHMRCMGSRHADRTPAAGAHHSGTRRMTLAR
jgi:hypothetical protein